jgi:hypothetical protein
MQEMAEGLADIFLNGVLAREWGDKGRVASSKQFNLILKIPNQNSKLFPAAYRYRCMQSLSILLINTSGCWFYT